MKLNKYFWISALALLSCTIFSCKDDDGIVAGEEVGTDMVTFVGETNYALELTDTAFAIYLQRVSSKGELTVPLEVIKKADELTVPSSVTFADGDSVKAVNIGLSKEAKAFVDYPLVLSIPGKYAGTTYMAYDTLTNTPYDTYPRLEITVHKEDYKMWGVLTYQSWYFGDSWDSDLYYSEYMDIFRSDIFTDGYPFYMKINDEKHTLAFIGSDGVEKTDNYIGYEHPDYGSMFTRWVKDYEVEWEDGVYWFVTQYRVSAGSFGTNYDALMIQKDE